MTDEDEDWIPVVTVSYDWIAQHATWPKLLNAGERAGKMEAVDLGEQTFWRLMER